MVFYRKYRPQKLVELDKEEVRERLLAIFKFEKTPHAFLFAGPKGTGKTSAARIVAKIINCENRRKGANEPCNKCDNCQSIQKGINVDVIEIDAASNRGVDEIRDLRERVALAPAVGKYKVYIIDEVHMLTREAFNALLKTLEEPPAHVVFILATTEAHRLPGTIVSRCVALNFSKAKEAEIVRSLKRAVKAENLDISEEALKTIAGSSDGSFRDGVKILEQAYLEDKLDVESIKKIVGRGSSVSQFIELLAKKDAKGALEYIGEIVDSGMDMRHFVENVIDYLHEMLLSNYNIRNSKFEIRNSKIKIHGNDLKRLISLFSRAYLEMKTSFIEQLPIELVVVEWCSEIG